MKVQHYPLVIVGGGDLGTAALYVTAMYTNVSRIRLIERFGELASVNSHHENNSQTLHRGDIETNYVLEKSKEVKPAADLLAHFMENHARACFTKQGKMVFAIGDEEVAELEARYIEFKSLYPDLQRIEAAEIARLEPMLMKGRDPNQKVLALYTPNGYTVNYKLLAETFVKQAKETGKDITVSLNCAMKEIKALGKGYRIVMENGEVCFAETVVLAAGPHSLMFAKTLGYGKHLGILSVAGNYYKVEGQTLVSNKVYRVQKKKLPFAAVHADPEFMDPTTTRIGPTAEILPMLIRHCYDTVFDFIKTSVWTPKGIKVLAGIITDSTLMPYMLENMMYQLPFIGKRLFLKEARELFPTLTAESLQECKGKGGVRPQPVNTETGEMGMDSHFEGHNLIVEITPSPGATKCLATGLKAAQRVVTFLNSGPYVPMPRVAGKSQRGWDRYHFDQAAWDRDFNQVPEVVTQ